MLGWELPPHNAGGMGVVCYQMARALAGRGVSIDFVLPYTAHHPNTEFMNIVSTTPRSPQRGDGTWVYDSFAAGGPRMKRIQDDYLSVAVAHAKKFPPDVIHAHDWLTLRAGMAVKNATNRPLIAHIHATEFDRAGGKEGNPIIHDIEQAGLLMADRIIAISKLQHDLIAERYNIPSDKIEIVHNTIDYNDFAEPVNGDTYRYARRLQDEGYCVVSVMNRLTVQKGLSYFMRAAAKASHRLGRFVFIIGGDGEQDVACLVQHRGQMFCGGAGRAVDAVGMGDAHSRAPRPLHLCRCRSGVDAQQRGRVGHFGLAGHWAGTHAHCGDAVGGWQTAPMASDVFESTVAVTAGLQAMICDALEAVEPDARFESTRWQRDGGGGGHTRVLQGGAVFEKAGVNTSVVFGAVPPVAADHRRQPLHGGLRRGGRRAGAPAGIEAAAPPRCDDGHRPHARRGDRGHPPGRRGSRTRWLPARASRPRSSTCPGAG